MKCWILIQIFWENPIVFSTVGNPNPGAHALTNLLSPICSFLGKNRIIPKIPNVIALGDPFRIFRSVIGNHSINVIDLFSQVRLLMVGRTHQTVHQIVTVPL